MPQRLLRGGRRREESGGEGSGGEGSGGEGTKYVCRKEEQMRGCKQIVGWGGGGGRVVQSEE